MKSLSYPQTSGLLRVKHRPRTWDRAGNLTFKQGHVFIPLFLLSPFGFLKRTRWGKKDDVSFLLLLRMESRQATSPCLAREETARAQLLFIPHPAFTTNILLSLGIFKSSNKPHFPKVFPPGGTASPTLKKKKDKITPRSLTDF